MKKIKSYFLDILVHHYFDFRGKTTRKQFWMFILFAIIFYVVGVLIFAIFGATVDALIANVLILFLTIPTLAITSRRLHDTGHSFWWIFCPVCTTISGFLPIGWENDLMLNNFTFAMFWGWFCLFMLVGNILLLVFLCSASKKTIVQP